MAHGSKIESSRLLTKIYLNFLFWLLIPSLQFFFGISFYFSIVLFGIFLIWVHFNPFYFLFVSEGAFVFDDLGEYTFKDLDD
jgi:hypothetical protein